MFKSRPENNKGFNEAILRMAYIAEIKEWDNRLHLERIRKYGSVICTSLGMMQQEVETISLACQLHDIGKVFIPEEILMKTSKFTPVEWEVIEKHTIFGAQILSGSTSIILQTAEAIALSHHERWDGTGYPQGLKGEEIPISARICALADVYDALTTKRPYKNTLEDAEALKIILNAEGSLFDPQIVKIFKEKINDFTRARLAPALN